MKVSSLCVGFKLFLLELSLYFTIFFVFYFYIAHHPMFLFIYFLFIEPLSLFPPQRKRFSPASTPDVSSLYSILPKRVYLMIPKISS